jgi:hypothetical protein
MVTWHFRLTVNQKADIAVACRIGKERLAKLSSLIENRPLTIKKSQITRLIRDEIGPTEGETLAALLFGIASTFRRNASSPKEVLDGITVAIASSEEADPRFDAWPECKPVLLKILISPSVSLAAKAEDISYDFERIYMAGRVLTSIRPVFDEPRNVIIGATIVQTLRLEYTSTDGRMSSISVSLDMDDIKELGAECQRAINKANAARLRIQKDCRIEALLPGEEETP